MDNAFKPTRPFLASTNTSSFASWQTNMDQSNISPVPSLQPDAYFMHGGHAGAGYSQPVFLARRNGPAYGYLGVAGYTCVHPGCEVPVFPDEAALDQHIQQHFNPCIPPHGHDARIHNAITSNAYYGAAIPKTPHPDHFTGFHHQPPAPAAPNLAFSTSTGPVSNTPSTTNYPASPPATKRYHCSYPGCDVSVKNAADLTRHAKKHQDGPKEYGCPIRGCPREGLRGFARKDKLNDHLKAKHKMSRIG